MATFILLGETKGTPDPEQPKPPSGWRTWQKIVGWVRKLLNLGNSAGLWPNQRPRV